MVGLDEAGKKTIMYKLKGNDLVSTVPTIGKHRIQSVNVIDVYWVRLCIGMSWETVEHKNMIINLLEVGGYDKIRPLWRHYFQDTQGTFSILDVH